jgi:hypothetical protein
VSPTLSPSERDTTSFIMTQKDKGILLVPSRLLPQLLPLFLFSSNLTLPMFDYSELLRSEREVDVTVTGQDRLPWEGEAIEVEVPVLDRDKVGGHISCEDLLRDSSAGNPPSLIIGRGGGDSRKCRDIWQYPGSKRRSLTRP